MQKSRTLVEMPVVSQCAVSRCGFNAENTCQAKAITVGHGTTPACDTFFAGAAQAAEQPRDCGVGACKVESCKHNESLQCGAPNGIAMGVVDGEPRCTAFEQR